MKLLKVCGCCDSYSDIWFEMEIDYISQYVKAKVNKGNELLKIYKCQVPTDNFDMLIKQFTFVENENDLLNLLSDVSYNVVEESTYFTKEEIKKLLNNDCFVYIRGVL